MNANVEYLLQLVNSVLYDLPAPSPGECVEWDAVFSAARAGEVMSILYGKINEIEGDKRLSEEMLSSLQTSCINTGIMKLEKYRQLAVVLEQAKQRGISVVVFKGPVLAQLYPEPMLRNSCDMDLYVEPEDLPAFEALLVENGYVKNEEHSKECVPVYVYGNLLAIEAHCRLYEDYTGKRIQMLENMNLTNPDTRVVMNACGLEFVTLGYEEQLVFLLFHLIKHVSYNGCSIKTIVDIVLYINAYLDKISKESFWKKMKQLGYDTFCRTIFSIGVYYFGMTREIFLENDYCENVAIQSMERMYETGILKASVLGYEDDRRAAAIAFQSYYDRDDKKVNKFRMLQKTMFPRSKDLSFRYMYARKHPALVWVAWLHRAWNCLADHLFSDKKEHIDMLGDVKLANQKISLLRDLDLMQKD